MPPRPLGPDGGPDQREAGCRTGEVCGAASVNKLPFLTLCRHPFLPLWGAGFQGAHIRPRPPALPLRAARSGARQGGCLFDFFDLRGGAASGPDQPFERCRRRQLPFPVSTVPQWCTGRSSGAAAVYLSPNTDGHSENDRFVVTITDVRSQGGSGDGTGAGHPSRTSASRRSAKFTVSKKRPRAPFRMHPRHRREVALAGAADQHGVARAVQETAFGHPPQQGSSPPRAAGRARAAPAPRSPRAAALSAPGASVVRKPGSDRVSAHSCIIIFQFQRFRRPAPAASILTWLKASCAASDTGRSNGDPWAEMPRSLLSDAAAISKRAGIWPSRGPEPPQASCKRQERTDRRACPP